MKKSLVILGTLALLLTSIPVHSMMLSKKYLKHKDKIRIINNRLIANKKKKPTMRASPQERMLVDIDSAKDPVSVTSLTSINDYMVKSN